MIILKLHYAQKNMMMKISLHLLLVFYIFIVMCLIHIKQRVARYCIMNEIYL